MHSTLQNRGLYEDRAEIAFEDLVTGTRFVIVRSVVIIVGSQHDQDTLKPVVPYAPLKQKRRQVTHIVQGIVSALFLFHRLKTLLTPDFAGPSGGKYHTMDRKASTSKHSTGPRRVVS